jgi:carboxypeptidase C (cathepsin A)
MRRVALALIAGAGIGFVSTSSYAQQPAPQTPNPTSSKGACTEDQKASSTATEGEVTIGGKKIRYKATVGFTEVTLDPAHFSGIFNNQGLTPADNPATPPKACIFSTYYRMLPADSKGQKEFTEGRPITFAFNGGPGSASLWLHLGLMGPKRVDLGPEGLTPPPTPTLLENQDSPLDLTDIVMVDPVATGFSRAEKGSDQKSFFGYQYDAESIATFISDFVDRHDRSLSPLYVLGESYGGMRGPTVVQLLQASLSRRVAGLVLVSPCLSSMVWEFNILDVDTPYWTFFPTMAAIAWYHKHDNKVYPDYKYKNDTPEQVYQKAYQFAKYTYAPALLEGNAHEQVKPSYESVAQQMADFLGMDVSLIEGWGLRISDQQFFSYVLSNTATGKQVGRYDGRYSGNKLTSETGYTPGDPSNNEQGFAFVGAINRYLREDLNYKTDRNYVAGADVGNWSFGSDANQIATTYNLSKAFADNKMLRVFVASGYYDMACPMGTVEFERNRLDPTSEGRSRMELYHYEGGHMMYTNPVALTRLKQDLAGFYARTLAPRAASGAQAASRLK